MFSSLPISGDIITSNVLILLNFFHDFIDFFNDWPAGFHPCLALAGAFLLFLVLNIWGSIWKKDLTLKWPWRSRSRANSRSRGNNQGSLLRLCLNSLSVRLLLFELFPLTEFVYCLTLPLTTRSRKGLGKVITKRKISRSVDCRCKKIGFPFKKTKLTLK